MITIQTKEWFDKQNGNTYFSAEVFLGMDKILSLPFQYGYSGARDTVERILAKHFDSCAERWELRDLLRKNGIEISETKSKALKRELSKESFEDFTPFLKPANIRQYALKRLVNQIPFTVGEKSFHIVVLNTDCVFNEDNRAIAMTDLNWF